MTEPDERLDRLVVADLTDELGIFGRARDSMLADPVRARDSIEQARRKTRVRNPAALAIALFRQAVDRGRLAEPEVDADPGLPTLSAIELLWSMEPSKTSETLLGVVSAAIGGRGGFAAIKDSFRQRDRYDALGELVERATAVDVDDGTT